jgi:hypothetical protein
MPAAVDIRLEPSTHARIEEYAKAVGRSVESVMDRAINQWMDIIGDDVVCELRLRRAGQKTRQTVLEVTAKATGSIN